MFCELFFLHFFEHESSGGVGKGLGSGNPPFQFWIFWFEVGTKFILLWCDFAAEARGRRKLHWNSINLVGNPNDKRTFWVSPPPLGIFHRVTSP